jgi:hypothetical protein
VSIPEDSVTTIRQKNVLGQVQKFLQGFHFRFNIHIEPVQIALTRFNPQCKIASTHVAHRMTFKVTIQI